MELEKALQSLGLGRYAAKVYPALLKLGPTNAGPVISSTKLHRQFVYSALEELCSLKLASCIIRNNRKRFHPAPPSALINALKAKEKLAEEIVPRLAAMQLEQEDRLEVRTIYGNDALIENLREIVNSAASTDRTLRIIGGASDRMFYDAIGKRYEEYRELLERMQVKKYLIAPEDMSEEFKIHFAKEKSSFLRTLARGLSSPTYTRITQEMVSIEIYGKEPMVIQIRNRAVALGYIEHFNLLWSEGRTFRRAEAKERKNERD